MWQYSVNSMAHLRSNKRQCCSAGERGSKQPVKCTQEFLTLDDCSVNSTQKSDCNRNRCHCSVQLLINVAFVACSCMRLGWNELRARLLHLLS
jgi:hypothetical protein